MAYFIRTLHGLFVISLLTAFHSAAAAPLNLVPGPQDFQLSTTGEVINYNSTTGELTISGTVGCFTSGKTCPCPIATR